MRHGQKNAVVLGASAEAGTGWTIAQLLSKDDLNVAVGARRREGIKKLAASIGGCDIQCDCTVETEVAAMADAAVEAFGGKIDTAILVAGDSVVGTIDSISESDLQGVTALNYTAAIYFVRHMARRMNDNGSIVLMSSVAAMRPWPGYFAYACAKAALQTLVEYAALEYAPRGIRVNAVVPGPIQTPVARETLAIPHIRDAMSYEIPLGRPVLPGEVGEVAVWLATRAPWITGISLVADGGMHLRRPPFANELQPPAKAS